MSLPNDVLLPWEATYPEAMEPGWRLVCAAGTDVSFYEAELGAATTWTGALAGISGAFAWALKTNPSTSLVELFINGLSKGAQALTPGFTSVADLAVGIDFDGRQQEVVVVEGEVSFEDIRAVYKAAVPGYWS